MINDIGDHLSGEEWWSVCTRVWRVQVLGYPSKINVHESIVWWIDVEYENDWNERIIAGYWDVYYYECFWEVKNEVEMKRFMDLDGKNGIYWKNIWYHIFISWYKQYKLNF